MIQNWNNKRVLIIGAARQGLALARYLSRQDSQVILNDKHTAVELQNAVESMQDYPIQWVLGHHPFSILDSVDIVCLSGGVPSDLPIVVEARNRGLPLSNDTQIFMDIVPAPVIGITGSAGKTTTTTLVGKIAEKALAPALTVWVGGNIGLPLIDRVGEIHAQDIVILEMSSFQLELMTVSPHIAAILNITPNHLDRHGTLEDYSAAKGRILDFQKRDDIAILSRDDPGAWKLKDSVKGRLLTFGVNQPGKDTDGTYSEKGTIFYQSGGQSTAIMGMDSIKLRGRHNFLNILAACCITAAMDLPIEAMKTAVEQFRGIPHRLEFVREWNGAKWYNDSIATAPERTIAAINAFEEPLVLLLGGRDKKLPWEDLANLVHQRVKHLVVFGESAEMIQKAVGSLHAGETLISINRCDSLQEAVQTAGQFAVPGDIVLLSPGGTSFDSFKDFEERGERYRLWVNNLS